MMATDPVCLPIVDEDNAKFTSKYREQKYHFCCNWRKKKFEEKTGEIHAYLNGYLS